MAGCFLALLSGNLVESFTADTYLMTLCSVQTWLPFFWGQNRYGMFIPLLLSGASGYEFNLMGQTAIHVGSVIGTFHLVGKLFFPESSRRVALFALLIYLALLPIYARQMLNIAQPYAPAALLTLLSLVAWRHRTWTPATRGFLFGVSNLISFYINIAGFPFAVGVLGLLFLNERERERRCKIPVLMAVLIGAFLVNLYASSLSPFATSAAHNVFRAAQPRFGDHTAWDWFILKNGRLVGSIAGLALLAGVLKWMWPAGAPRTISWWFIGFAAAHLIIIALVPWVAEFYYAPRYFATAAMLFSVAAAAVLGDLPRFDQRIAQAGILLFLGCLFAWVYRPGTYISARTRVELQVAPSVRSLEKSGAVLFFGEFEECWPVVFWANAKFQRSGSPQVCYGLGPRSFVQFKQVQPFLSQPKAVCFAGSASRLDGFMSAEVAGPFVKEYELEGHTVGHFLPPSTR